MTKEIENFASIKIRDHAANEAKLAAARTMLTALKHARSILMTPAEKRNRASENMVWLEIKDAIAQAQAAGIK